MGEKGALAVAHGVAGLWGEGGEEWVKILVRNGGLRG